MLLLFDFVDMSIDGRIILRRSFPRISGHGILYGDVIGQSLLVWIGLLVVMYPLAIWFGGVKRRNKSWIIKMI